MVTSRAEQLRKVRESNDPKKLERRRKQKRESSARNNAKPERKEQKREWQDKKNAKELTPKRKEQKREWQDKKNAKELTKTIEKESKMVASAVEKDTELVEANVAKTIEKESKMVASAVEKDTELVDANVAKTIEKESKMVASAVEKDTELVEANVALAKKNEELTTQLQELEAFWQDSSQKIDSGKEEVRAQLQQEIADMSAKHSEKIRALVGRLSALEQERNELKQLSVDQEQKVSHMQEQSHQALNAALAEHEKEMEGLHENVAAAIMARKNIEKYSPYSKILPISLRPNGTERALPWNLTSRPHVLSAQPRQPEDIPPRKKVTPCQVFSHSC
jgi:hypothetical protein